MNQFKKKLQIRWADLDPNGHVRHSVYYDWGAYCRIAFLTANDLSPSQMMELQVGPVIFREECVFKKEVRQEEELLIDLELVQARRNFSRWTVRHSICKEGGVLAAVITLDGAWIDTVKRKLTTPPVQVFDAYGVMPKSAAFEWLD
ncbi:thioesterase [Niabella ginsenosidivorans]|uniref:Thioesterase n=2 Tax=Niabella ginsenosidivorans TaxID=1176587 RepID=A0A1A9I501_9BACT|nr:thioesterase [Niabella ginsenosidivorans]